MNSYRRQVSGIFADLLNPIVPIDTALDFGSGDGWFAEQMEDSRLVRAVTPVEVQERPGARRKPVVYDGHRLPFADRAFEMSYAVDVFHHCPDPVASLRDALRVSKRWFLLKDHTWNRRLSYWLLCTLDEIGNRRFGVPCRYQHQHGWEWFDAIQSEGFELVKLTHPAPCHRGMMRFINRFEFVSLWRRIGAQ